MNSDSVRDLIMRAVAALRERGELPEVERPQISVARVAGEGPAVYRSNLGVALAKAVTGDAQPAANPYRLAVSVVEYLSEVIELVPAYHDVLAITAAEDGSVTVTLRQRHDNEAST